MGNLNLHQVLCKHLSKASLNRKTRVHICGYKHAFIRQYYEHFTHQLIRFSCEREADGWRLQCDCFVLCFIFQFTFNCIYFWEMNWKWLIPWFASGMHLCLCTSYMMQRSWSYFLLSLIIRYKSEHIWYVVYYDFYLIA